MTAPPDSREETLLIYDQQCPVCDLYCRTLQKNDDSGVRLVDARTNPDIVAKLTALGVDIDQNMVLARDGHFYVGADAIHRLTTLTKPTSLFRWLNRRLFQSSRRAHRLYPLMRAGRNLLLKLLRRTKINNLGLENNERF